MPKERGAAELKFFKAWLNNQIIPPVPLSKISSASAAPAVVIVTPVNDNKDNFFNLFIVRMQLCNSFKNMIVP